MKKMFFAVVAMLFVSALQGAAKSCDVNVMQWNLHIAIDMNGRYNLKKQADVILTHDPDVVVLNEIDKNCARTGYIDMTRELATMTGMCFSQFGAARVLPPEGLYGNAVLSRYAMELVGSWHIPASLDEPRGMTLVKMIKDAMMSTTRGKIGGALVKPGMKQVLKKFSTEEYGGAPLLGLKGLVVKSHGSSKAEEVKNSVLQCIDFKKYDINRKISESLSCSDVQE